MPNETTVNLGLAKVHQLNKLKDDVERLRQFADQVDVSLQQLLTGMAGKAEASALSAYQTRGEKGVAGGYGELDNDALLPLTRIPAALRTAMFHQGPWNAATNQPELPPPSPGNKGYFWTVSVAGASNKGGFTDWQLNDWVWSDGVVWRKLYNSPRPTDIWRERLITSASYAGAAFQDMAFNSNPGPYYSSVVVCIDDFRPSQDGQAPLIQLRDNHGVLVIVNYEQAAVAAAPGTTPGTAVADRDTTSSWFLTYPSDGDSGDDASSDVTRGFAARLEIINVASPAQTFIRGGLVYADSNDVFRPVDFSGRQKDGVIAKSLRLSVNAGTFSARVSLWGVS